MEGRSGKEGGEVLECKKSGYDEMIDDAAGGCDVRVFWKLFGMREREGEGGVLWWWGRHTCGGKEGGVGVR